MFSASTMNTRSLIAEEHLSRVPADKLTTEYIMQAVHEHRIHTMAGIEAYLGLPRRTLKYAKNLNFGKIRYAIAISRRMHIGHKVLTVLKPAEEVMSTVDMINEKNIRKLYIELYGGCRL